jgi:nitrite reductase/ring-hydroxylating ferredoxin subunit
VLFRDQSGTVRSLEDRCPHRRVPLSLGKVINGQLRCAYHGWTFEGERGQCVNIPNLNESEKISPQLRADAFRVREHEGFIYLASRQDSAGAAEFPLTLPAALQEAPQASGRQVLSVEAPTYLAALLDGPHLLLGLTGVCLTDFFIGDVSRSPGALTLYRTAIWSHKRKPHEKQWGLSSLSLRTEIFPAQSAARLTLLDVGDTPLLSVVLAVVPGQRHTVQVHWRCAWLADYAAAAPALVRWRARGQQCPLQIYPTIAGAALADLLPGPSVYLAAPDHLADSGAATGAAACSHSTAGEVSL